MKNYNRIFLIALAVFFSLGTALAASLVSGKSFLDSGFAIVDEGDTSKVLDFEVSGLTTGTTRTLTIPDKDLDLGSLDDSVTKTVSFDVIAIDGSLATGNKQACYVVPEEVGGMDLISVGAHVFTASSSGLPSIMINNATDAADMLSVAITIDVNEKDSSSAATAPTINTSTDDVVEGDEVCVDVDGAGTGTLGLQVRLGFKTP